MGQAANAICLGRRCGPVLQNLVGVQQNIQAIVQEQADQLVIGSGNDIVVGIPLAQGLVGNQSQLLKIGLSAGQRLLRAVIQLVETGFEKPAALANDRHYISVRTPVVGASLLDQLFQRRDDP